MIIPRVRQQADFRVRASGVGFDAIDQGGAAGCRGEEAFEDDQRRTMERDGFERFEGLRVGETQRVAADGGALLESRKQVA